MEERESTGQDEAATAPGLAEALVEMSSKYAEAERRAAAAEQKVEYLEDRVRELEAENERLRVGGGESGPTTGTLPRSDLPPPGYGGPWWRERRRRRKGIE